MFRLILGMMALAPGITAQRSWLDPLPGSGVAFSTTLGHFDDNVTRSPAATFAVRGWQAVAGDVTLRAELPAARVRLHNGLDGTAVGNPWIGVEYAPRSGMQFELGARLNLWSPDAQEDAMAYAYGALMDFDRNEAWHPRTWAVRAIAHAGRVPAHGSFVTTRFGVAGLAMGGGGGDGELLAHYGARAGVAGNAWAAWVGVIGQGFVTESGVSLADRTTHLAEATVATRGDRLRAVFSLQRYIGESFTSSIPVLARLTLGARL